MEAALPSDHFLRIHRSFLVLLKHVTALDRHTVYLSGRQLPLGDSYRPALEAFVLFVSNTKPRNYAKSTRSGSHAL
jgi:two-component system LytT family response regulator